MLSGTEVCFKLKSNANAVSPEANGDVVISCDTCKSSNQGNID